MNANDPPVTVDVLQRVKVGSEIEFENVLAELIQAAEKFEGHLGSNVFRISDRDRPEYRIVFKFDRLSHLKQWENSEVRCRLIDKAKKFTSEDIKLQIITGLETWFTLSTTAAIVPPPRYKMLIVTILAAVPTANLTNFALQRLDGLPAFFRSLLTTVILLSLMTYIVMPRVTKLFAAWLYPSR